MPNAEGLMPNAENAEAGQPAHPRVLLGPMSLNLVPPVHRATHRIGLYLSGLRDAKLSQGDAHILALLDETSPATIGDRLVVQVSRWDRLKDPVGVIRGFADHVAPYVDAHLIVAGPAVDAVADDPEGRQMLQESVQAWNALPPAARRSVHLASLPMMDAQENAAMVNALQRHAEVVVQKSLAEGFGLTVAEAMWKGRPVVASRIGGIQDQIDDGRTGLLIDDPRDLGQYGRCVMSLLEDPARARKIGEAAREQVRNYFLGPRHLMQYAQLLEDLISSSVQGAVS